MTIWRVGMKAVCVVDEPWVEVSSNKITHGPKLGAVYTVSGLDSCWYGQTICLSEFSDDDFLAKAFRPVAKRTTDISIFKELLLNPNKEIREDA